MENIFLGVILGHLVGDYLLQSRKMALKKSQPGFAGLLWSICHCLVYTVSVCSLIWNFRPEVVLIVFFSHWPIDRYSLARHWYNFMGDPSLYDAYLKNEVYGKIEARKIIAISFSCLHYAVADNAMHLLIIWVAFQFLKF